MLLLPRKSSLIAAKLRYTYLHIYIYIYIYLSIRVYTCMSVRLGCVTDALSVRAMQRIVGMIERKEREKGKESVFKFF